MLTVLSFSGRTHKNKRIWLCRCDCGGTVEITSFTGNVWNCGCTRKFGGPLKHGFASTKQRPCPEYITYKNMLARCRANHKRRADYFDRGIGVCDRWVNGDGTSPGFSCFLDDVGPRPSPKHSLDRIDNEKGYSPENCRWASTNQQARNTRSNHYVTYGGERLSLIEACERANVSYGKMRDRLRKAGMSFEEALLGPKKITPEDVERAA